MQIVKVEDIPIAKEASIEDPLNLYKTFNDMEILCREANGIGLAAVQVGIPLKLFIVLDFPFFAERIFYGINCTYTPKDHSKEPSLEGCLSLPNRFFMVKRYREIAINGYRLTIKDGQPKVVEVKDFVIDALFMGNVFQHEIDHTEDVLISDIGKEVEIAN